MLVKVWQNTKWADGHWITGDPHPDAAAHGPKGGEIRLGRVVPLSAVVIERDANGEWPVVVTMRTIAAWHGAGWWDQASTGQRVEAAKAVHSWLNALEQEGT